MQDAMVCWRNWADSAVLSTTVDHTIVHALSLLQTRNMGELCVMSGNTFEVRADLGRERRIDAVGLLGLEGQYTVSTGTGRLAVSGGVTISNNADFSAPVYAQGWGYSEYPPFDNPLNGQLLLDAPVYARYVRLIAFEPTPAEIERGAARLWVGPGLRVKCDAGWSSGGRDTGQIGEAGGTEVTAAKGVISRRLSLTFSGFTQLEAIGIDHAGEAVDVPNFEALKREAGTTGEVLIYPRTKSFAWLNRLGIHGRLEQVPNVQHKAGVYHATGLTVLQEHAE